MKKINVIGIVLIVISLLFVSCQTTEPNLKTISVTGSAEIALQPDTASFSISISEIADTTAEAQTQTNAKMKEVLSILENDFALPKDGIQTTYASLAPYYEWIDGQRTLIGQQSSQQIKVKLNDLTILGKLIDSLSNVSSISLSSISLDKADKSEAYKEARSMAVKAATEKAEIYATAAGLTLGDATNISEQSSYGYANTYAKEAMVAMAYDESSSMDYRAGEITVSVNINISYEMK